MIIIIFRRSSVCSKLYNLDLHDEEKDFDEDAAAEKGKRIGPMESSCVATACVDLSLLGDASFFSLDIFTGVVNQFFFSKFFKNYFNYSVLFSAQSKSQWHAGHGCRPYQSGSLTSEPYLRWLLIRWGSV